MSLLLPKCIGTAAAQQRARRLNMCDIIRCADESTSNKRTRKQLPKKRDNLWKNNTWKNLYNIWGSASNSVCPSFQAIIVQQEQALNSNQPLGFACRDQLRATGNNAINPKIMQILNASAVLSNPTNKIDMDHYPFSMLMRLNKQRGKLQSIPFEQKEQVHIRI